jgi:hypothetical protein
MGAAEASCMAGLDYPPFDLLPVDSVGFWSFEVTSEGPRVTYSDDAVHPFDGVGHAFTENDCSVFAMNDDGMWIDSSLGEAFDM